MASGVSESGWPVPLLGSHGDLIRGVRLRLAGLEGGQSVLGLLGPKLVDPRVRADRDLQGVRYYWD